MVKNKVKRVIIESGFGQSEHQYARVVFERQSGAEPQMYHPNRRSLATVYKLCRDMVVSGQASNGDVSIYTDGTFAVWYWINGAQ